MHDFIGPMNPLYFSTRGAKPFLTRLGMSGLALSVFTQIQTNLSE